MIFKTIDQFVAHNNLIKNGDTIIIGLSGGPDSMFLLNYFAHVQAAKKLILIAAHLDHQWRKESGKDLLFCQEYCEKHNILFVAGRASELTIASSKTGSKEDTGRTLRRAFFQEIKERYHANSIALAHHHDDQLETFFIRLIRGTTVTGLSCIRPRQGAYIRPLLPITKQQVLAYLSHKHIPYVVDQTNTSPAYLRNRIRMSLIPVLQNIDKRYALNMQKTIHNLQETDIFLQNLTQQTYQHIQTQTDGIDIKKLLALDRFIQKLVIAHWLYRAQVSFTISSSFLSEILRFLRNSKSNCHYFNQWCITKARGMATISKEIMQDSTTKPH